MIFYSLVDFIIEEFLFRVNREPTSAVEYTVPNLVDGREYEFRVAAVNKAGPGEYGNFEEYE